MIAAGRVAAILLAAGLSRRFGEADKIAAPIDGVPLGLHAARLLGAMPFLARIVVTGPDSLDYAREGFTIVVNAQPEQGMSHSIRLGVRAARKSGAEAILIALADMPFVRHDHIGHMLDRYEDAQSIIASRNHAPCPPALFGNAWFHRLEGLEGERGAKALLHAAKLITPDPRTLADFDTQADFTKAIGRPTNRAG
jgi:molybdenum cofactor cytidylyltransferase